MKKLGRILEILIITILIMVAVMIIGGLSSCKVVDKHYVIDKKTKQVEVLPFMKPNINPKRK